jgi:glycosidase
MVRKLVFFISFISPFFSFAHTSIEPPFWWAGMQNDTLQLMLEDKDIAEAEIQIKGENIHLLKTHRADHKDYLFVDLLIKDAPPQKFQIKIKCGLKRTSIAYELKNRNTNESVNEGFNYSDAIYLITPDRFSNGNTTNDNLEGYDDKLNREDDYGRHGGDLEGIISQLEYIQWLGFTAIWLNPLLENNMPKYSYHGYAITDFYKVDPRFGSNELYRDLADSCKKLGLKLIMDQIVNHCGSEHRWVANPPFSDWFNHQGKYKKTNHYHSLSLDPYASDQSYAGFKDGWFDNSMPDLNQRNPFVAKYLIQHSIWWVEFAGLNGIRMDTYPYAEDEFLHNWSCAIMNEYPNFNIVGEEWTTNPVITSSWQKDSKLNKDGCLPSVMDFPLQAAIANATKDQNGLDRLFELLGNDHLYGDVNNLVVFADNHDMNRLAFQVDNEVNRIKMSLALIYALRGIPQVYYGTELLYNHTKNGDHGQIRKDFELGWPNEFVLTFDQTQVTQYLRMLNAYRKLHPALQNGEMRHFVPEQGVYVFFRYLPDIEDKVMVVVNTSNEKASLSWETYAELIKGYQFYRGKATIKPEPLNLDATFEVEPQKVSFFEIIK